MGRKTSLTEEIAQKLEFYWQLGADTLSDEQICWRIGISYGQLKGWLKRDAIPVKPDGTLGPEGLRGIRARAKVSIVSRHGTCDNLAYHPCRHASNAVRFLAFASLCCGR